jgi:hypothetical protein
LIDAIFDTIADPALVIGITNVFAPIPTIFDAIKPIFTPIPAILAPIEDIFDTILPVAPVRPSGLRQNRCSQEKADCRRARRCSPAHIASCGYLAGVAYDEVGPRPAEKVWLNL